MAKTLVGMFAAAVMLTSVVIAVPAHADAGSDFLAMVSEQGINGGDTPADVQLTLAQGVLVCHFIDEGYTPEVARREIRYGLPNVTPQQLAGFVAAAQAKLCPTTFGPLNLGDY